MFANMWSKVDLCERKLLMVPYVLACVYNTVQIVTHITLHALYIYCVIAQMLRHIEC